MTFPFNPQRGLVLLEAEVTGPSGTGALLLALDTGATRTLINTASLVALGYDPALAPQQARMVTASGVAFVPQFPLLKITALGQDRVNFPVLCHAMPPGSKVYGLLGLDFFRGHVLTVDFQNGQITLA